MTGSVALDVVIGLVFIFLLYSLLATILQEIVSSWLNFRSKILEEAIKRMLDDDTKTTIFSGAFYRSPLIKYLAREKQKPAYLMAANFSKVILDLLKGENPTPGEDFRSKIDRSLTNGISLKSEKDEPKVIDTGGTFDFIKSLWAESNGDIERFKGQLEQWFDDTMARSSGWYKRRIQKVLFFIGLGIAIAFNVDSIEIASRLASDPTLREQLVQQADNFVKTHPDLDAELKKERDTYDSLQAKQGAADNLKLAQLEKTKSKRDSLVKKARDLVEKDIANANEVLGIGLGSIKWDGGWEFYKSSAGRLAFFRSFAGWLLTAFAISLGAPFWFDLLNKLMKLRTAVAISSTGKTVEEQSKISQAGGKDKNAKG